MRQFLCVMSVIFTATLAIADSYAGDRFALVIGNSKYNQIGSLKNPENDALAMYSKLTELGFDVTQGNNTNRKQMKSMLREFNNKLSSDSIALFFYAGHGIQYNGINYLIPINSDIKKAYEIEDQAINLNMVLSAINENKPRLSIIMLDACRNNPYKNKIQSASRSISFTTNGLTTIQSTHGSILSYATEPGNVAADGAGGNHSPYTAAMLNYLGTPGLSIQDMLNRVGLEVMKTTNDEQKPWYSSSPIPKFCLAGCNTPTIVEQIRLAITLRDMDTLRELVHLNQKLEAHLENIFEVYSKLSIEIVEHPHAGPGKPLVYKLVEAVNHAGNRVLPSSSWNKIHLYPKIES